MLFESNLNAVINADSNFFPGQKRSTRNFSAIHGVAINGDIVWQEREGESLIVLVMSI